MQCFARPSAGNNFFIVRKGIERGREDEGESDTWTKKEGGD